MTNRGPAFTEFLLDAIEEVIPIGSDEWDRVLALHNERWSQTGRTVDAFRRRFLRMHSKKIPTGNPYIAPNIQKAKMLQDKTVESSQTAAGDVSDDALGFLDDDMD